SLPPCFAVKSWKIPTKRCGATVRSMGSRTRCIDRPKMKAPEHSISLARVFAAPPETLYAAFTDPAVMRRWMGTKVEADIRIGGRYRIENDDGEGGVFFHVGEYLVLDPHHRIRQSFRAGFSEPALSGPSAYVIALVEVTSRPLSED